MLGASIGGILGGYLFTPLLSLGLTTVATVLIAYIGLPLYLYVSNKNRGRAEVRLYDELISIPHSFSSSKHPSTRACNCSA